MKIRVIDLLNKIANGEEVPKIKLDGKVYDFCTTCFANNETRNLIWSFPIETLNDELKLIEEDKEIEEILDIELLGQCDNWLQKRDVNIKSDFELNPYILEAISRNFKSLYHKQCELIKAVNELKKGK